MALAERSGRSRLVDLLAIEGQYPIYGAVWTEPAYAFERFGQVPLGVFVDTSLMIQLDLEVGERIRIGSESFEVVAGIVKAPGRFGFQAEIAPRIFMTRRDLDRTGLLQVGSLVTHLRYFKLPDGVANAWLRGERAPPRGRADPGPDPRDLSGGALRGLREPHALPGSRRPGGAPARQHRRRGGHARIRSGEAGRGGDPALDRGDAGGRHRDPRWARPRIGARGGGARGRRLLSDPAGAADRVPGAAARRGLALALAGRPRGGAAALDLGDVVMCPRSDPRSRRRAPRCGRCGAISGSRSERRTIGRTAILALVARLALCGFDLAGAEPPRGRGLRGGHPRERVPARALRAGADADAAKVSAARLRLLGAPGDREPLPPAQSHAPHHDRDRLRPLRDRHRPRRRAATCSRSSRPTPAPTARTSSCSTSRPTSRPASSSCSRSHGALVTDRAPIIAARLVERSPAVDRGGSARRRIALPRSPLGASARIPAHLSRSAAGQRRGRRGGVVGARARSAPTTCPIRSPSSSTWRSPSASASAMPSAGRSRASRSRRSSRTCATSIGVEWRRISSSCFRRRPSRRRPRAACCSPISRMPRRAPPSSATSSSEFPNVSALDATLILRSLDSMFDQIGIAVRVLSLFTLATGPRDPRRRVPRRPARARPRGLAAAGPRRLAVGAAADRVDGGGGAGGPGGGRRWSARPRRGGLSRDGSSSICPSIRRSSSSPALHSRPSSLTAIVGGADGGDGPGASPIEGLRGDSRLSGAL